MHCIHPRTDCQGSQICCTVHAVSNVEECYGRPSQSAAVSKPQTAQRQPAAWQLQHFPAPDVSALLCWPCCALLPAAHLLAAVGLE